MTERSRLTPFRDWWGQHAPGENQRTDRATFARLRRCGTPVQALLEPATVDLTRRLGVRPDERHRLTRVGVIAAVLAHVSSDRIGEPLAALLGRGDPKALSPMRFSVLVTAEPGEAQLHALRRAVARSDRAADVEDLGQSILWWGERRRVDWTFRYWGAGDTAPQPETRRTDQ